jgi:hypothetical protein
MLKQVDVQDHEGVMTALKEDGGLIVRNYLDAATLAQVRLTLTAALEDEPWCNNDESIGDEFFGLRTKRLHGLLRFGAEVESCLMHPLALELAPKFVGGPVIQSTGELMAIGGAETKQEFHRDGDSWLRAELADRNLLFSVNIALTDFHRENGATVLIPGSHRWPEDRQPDADNAAEELAYAEMPAGSALIYSGRTIHSGGQNQTDEPRLGLYFGYIPSWLRPLENSAQIVPATQYPTMGQGTRKMLGISDNGFLTRL